MNVFETDNTTPFKNENCTNINIPASYSNKQKGAIVKASTTSLTQKHKKVLTQKREGVSAPSLPAKKSKPSKLGVSKLAMQLAHEQSKRKQLEEELMLLRNVYEKQLATLEQSKETHQQNNKALLASNKELKAQVSDLHNQQKEDEIRCNELVRDYKGFLQQSKQSNVRVALLSEELKSLKEHSKIERKTWLEEKSELIARNEALEDSVAELLAGRPQTLGDILSQRKINHIVFGQAAWANYFGSVDKVPPLPSNIGDVLNASCPFWPQYKVRDTHLLVLIPSKVNGKSFTLDALDKLARCPHRDDCGTRFYHYEPIIADTLGRLYLENSHWILVTKRAVPDHNYIIGDKGQVIFDEKLSKFGYTVPSTLEMTTAILLYHLHTGKFIYPDRFPNKRCVYTRCHDRALRNNATVVGGLFGSGIKLYDLDHATRYFDFDIGVSPAMRL